MTYQADLRDIRFVLFDLLHLEELLGGEPFEDLDRDTIDQMLTEAEKFARNTLAPLNQVGDREGCRFEDGRVTVPPGFEEAYDSFCELGFLAGTAPPEEGGMGLPQAVSLAMDELFVSANCAFSNYPSLTRACANMLREWGTDDQKARYMEGLLTGRWQGTMCLTEPQAGSFVGAVRTMARPTDDGRWLISGQKTFITSANLDMVDNVIHFVLARTPDAPAGIKGISLFIVPHMKMDDEGNPTGDNDVQIVGIEEKMGIHGSVTTTLAFGDRGECVGELVGELNRGIQAMFHIMNEERIQVGLQGQAVGAAAYHEALQYARERIQGIPLGKRSRDPKDQVPIIEHPDVRRMLLRMKAYVEGCRAMLLKAGMHSDRVAAARSREDAALHQGWVELLTPICKAYCSEAGFEVTSLSMQVFGGASYIQETGVEQLMRDSRIAQVYEGTNGIQAMDLVFRKMTTDGGRLLHTWMSDLGRFVDEHQDHPELGAEIATLGEAKDQYLEVAGAVGGLLSRGELDRVGLHATELLRMSGNLMLGWMLLQEAVIAAGRLEGLPRDRDERIAMLQDNPALAHLDGKVHTARYFVNQMLSENHGLAKAITCADTSPMDVVL